MEPRFFEMSLIIYQSLWRHITGDLNFQQQRSREPQNMMQLVGHHNHLEDIKLSYSSPQDLVVFGDTEYREVNCAGTVFNRHIHSSV